MNEASEVYAMYQHYASKTPNKFYAINKTASLLSMNYEDVQFIVEKEESDD